MPIEYSRNMRALFRGCANYINNNNGQDSQATISRNWSWPWFLGRPEPVEEMELCSDG
jgi:hypothetical protein